MAYPVYWDTTYNDTAVSTFDVVLPNDIAEDDCIYLCCTQDVGSAAFSCTGFTVLGTQAANAGVRQGWLRKVADGTEGGTTITLNGTSRPWITTVIIVRDADVSGTPELVSARTDWTNVTTQVSPSLDCSANGSNQLLFYSIGMDSGSSSSRVTADYNDLIYIAEHADGNVVASHAVGYRVLGTAGAAPSINWYPTINNDGGNAWVVAVKNKSGGKTAVMKGTAPSPLFVGGLNGRYREHLAYALSTPAYSATANFTTDVFTLTGVTPADGDAFVFTAATGGGSFVNTHLNNYIFYAINSSGATCQLSLFPGGPVFDIITNNITASTLYKINGWVQAASAIAASINGITCSSNPPAYLTNASPFPGLVDGTLSAISSIDNTASAWVGGVFTVPSTDVSGKVISIEWNSVAAPSTRDGQEGVLFALSDGTNWVAYQLASRLFAGTVQKISGIAPGSATVYASSGTINLGAITSFGIIRHRVGSTTSGGPQIQFRNILLHNRSVMAGGNEYTPNSFTTPRTKLGWNYAAPLLPVQGSGQALARASIQIGDGSTTTYFDANAQSSETPPGFSANSAVRNTQNVNDNTIGVYVKASATDTVRLRNCVMASTTLQKFVIESASSTSANYDFSGLVVVGHTVAIDSAVSLASVSMSSCATISVSAAATLTSFIISDTVSSNAAISITTNGAKILGGSIAVPSTTDYHIELGTSVTSFDMTDLVLSGTPVVNQIHVLKTSGTVTITLADGQTQPTYTSAGATVVFPAAAVTLELTGLKSGSEVRCYTGTDPATAVEIGGIESSSTSFSFSHTSGGVAGVIVIASLGYVNISIPITYSSADQSIPISQQIDRQYENP